MLSVIISRERIIVATVRTALRILGYIYMQCLGVSSAMTILLIEHRPQQISGTNIRQ